MPEDRWATIANQMQPPQAADRWGAIAAQMQPLQQPQGGGFVGPQISPTMLASRNNDPSLVGGFMSEAKRRAMDLAGAIMNPIKPGVQVSTGMEPTGNTALDIAKGALDSGAAMPGGKYTTFMEGVRNSPLVSAARSLKNSATINRWLQIAPKEMEHGADPGARLLEEGLVRTTKGGTSQALAPALEDAGNQLTRELTYHTNTGQVIDGSNIVLNALDSTKKTIGKRTDPAFQNALSNILNDITKQFPDIEKLTPLRAQELKKAIGDAIQWHGNPFEGDINQSLLEAYRGINDELKGLGPAVDKLQKRWGDLYLASKAAKASMIKDAAGVGTGNLHPWVGTAAKSVGGAGLVGAADYAFRRLTSRPNTP